MLHTFFFVISFVMDCRAVTNAVDGGFMLGLTNACLVGVILAWQTSRRRVAAENREALRQNSIG